MYKPYVFDFKKMVVYDIVLPTLIHIINHY